MKFMERRELRYQNYQYSALIHLWELAFQPAVSGSPGIFFLRVAVKDGIQEGRPQQDTITVTTRLLVAQSETRTLIPHRTEQAELQQAFFVQRHAILSAKPRSRGLKLVHSRDTGKPDQGRRLPSGGYMMRPPTTVRKTVTLANSFGGILVRSSERMMKSAYSPGFSAPFFPSSNCA